MIKTDLVFIGWLVTKWRGKDERIGEGQREREGTELAESHCFRGLQGMHFGKPERADIWNVTTILPSFLSLRCFLLAPFSLNHAPENTLIYFAFNGRSWSPHPPTSKCFVHGPPLTETKGARRVPAAGLKAPSLIGKACEGYWMMQTVLHTQNIKWTYWSYTDKNIHTHTHISVSQYQPKRAFTPILPGRSVLSGLKRWQTYSWGQCDPFFIWVN